ncbi:hypothetical protein [Bermanella sp. R86510]|uniref:hypothetical protein n=1 Tax=unclassified Bermanella TaxID=2627862 RepID=UPI0037C7C140
MKETIFKGSTGSTTTTLIPSLSKINPNTFHLEVKIRGQNSPYPSDDIPPEKAQLKDAFDCLTKNFNEIIARDIDIINKFENSLSNYHLANRLRYYALDIGVPALSVLACLVSKLCFQIS